MKKIIAVVIAVVVGIGGCNAAVILTAGGGAASAAYYNQCSTSQGNLPKGTVPQPYNSIFTGAANFYKIPPALEAAIFMSEHGNTWPDASSAQATSPKGAMGWFQFIPSTWAGYSDSNPSNPNGDPQNLTDSAYAAAHYLSDLGAKPNMLPGNPDAPLKGTVAWVAGAYNGGSPIIGDSENDPYRKNAVEKFIEFSGGSSSSSNNTTVGATAVGSGSVYVLGDSIALGAKQELANALKQQYSGVYINASKSRSITGAGETPGYETSGLDALKQDANKSVGSFHGVSQAATIIIELGTNDLKGGKSFETKVDSLTNAIRGTGSDSSGINPNATIYWVEVFSQGTVDRDSLNNSLRKRASQDGYQIIPTINADIEVGSDNVHPTANGSTQFALLIAGGARQVTMDSCTSDPIASGSAEALARNPNITFTHPGPELDDLRSGRVSPRLIALLTWIAQKHKIGIFALVSDHDPGTNHEAGRAADIWMVDGDNCFPPDKAGGCWQLAQELDALNGCLHVTELIYYFDPGPSPDSFARSDHDDHIHAGYDGPLGPKHYNASTDPCSSEAITGN
jgi:hypothetical protein